MGNHQSATTSQQKPNSGIGNDTLSSIPTIREQMQYEYDVSCINVDLAPIPPNTAMTTCSSERISHCSRSRRVSQNDNSPFETSKISNEMMHITRMRNKRNSKRNSIHNGILGIYITHKSVQLASDFWDGNITELNMTEQLEIGCSIFFAMVASDIRIKRIFLGGNSSPNKLENVSLRFLDMMGYLMRSLLRNDGNLFTSLKSLGEMHTNIGVVPKMYPQMLTGMHETFDYYFPDQYTKEVKFALNEVFTVVSRVMTNQDLTNYITVDYLQSLDDCMRSLEGKSLLLSYLEQNGSHNIVSFYELLSKFKSQSNNIDRLKIGRDIVRFQIDGRYSKQKKIEEISSTTAQNIMHEMQKLEDGYPFIAIETSFFDAVEGEIYSLIRKKYWSGFKQSVLSMATM